MVTEDSFEAFLKCKSKSYLKSSGQSGAPSDLIDWQREVREDYRRRCCTRLRSMFPEEASSSRPLCLEDLKSAKHRLLTDCTVEVQGLRSHVHALERVSPRLNRKYSSYIPIRFVPNEKLSKDDKLLLAFDAFTLGAALGKAPLFGKIMHGAQQSIVKVKLAELTKVVRTVVEKIATQNASNEPPQLVLNRHCAECEFKPRCRQMALEKGELSLLPRMSKVERERLHERGIFSIHQLSYTFRQRRRPKRLASNPNKYFHALKALAIREKKIHILGRPELDTGGTKIFLDVEGVPDRDFYYLIGLRIRSGNSCVRHSFWANDLPNEKEIWVSLVNLLVETQSPQLIYYGTYEAVFLKRMKQRYAEFVGDSIALDRLTKDSVNVLQVIYPHIYFPTYSNSLKEIAQHLGFRWSDTTPSGLNSLVWRSKWELTRDPGLRERLITYNAEDCEALETVFDAIVQLLQRHDDKVKTSADRVVHVESLRDDDFHRFGRIEFLLPELDYINRAAYWDYQRSKIYVRSSQRLKRIFRNTSPRPIRRPRPNKIVECHSLRPPICPRCHAETIYKYGKLSKTVYDLKFGPVGVKRWIVKYYFSRFICWRCKRTLVSHRPLWTRSKYGSSFLAYLLYNVVDLQLSQSAAARILNQFFGFYLKRGAINCLKKGAARFYQDTYKRILSNIVRGKLVHADETKVSIEGRDAFVWVFTNLEEVAYVYSDTRTSATPKVLLADFHGVLVSDFYAGYDSIECRQQKCLIHLIRDLNDDLLRHPFNDELSELVREFAMLLKLVIQTVDRFGLKAHFLRKHLRSVERFFNGLAKRDLQSEIALKYRSRFKKNRNKLFTFLEYDGVPWNNNNAEHAIKALADLCSVIGGTSSRKGIQEYLTLLSICQTCKYKGVDFLQFVRSGERDIDRFAKNSRQR